MASGPAPTLPSLPTLRGRVEWGLRCEITACHPPSRASGCIRMVFNLAAIAARFHLRAGGLIGAVASLALALQIGNASAAGPEVANFTLPNGLDVVVIPDHRTPVVTHMIWYK